MSESDLDTVIPAGPRKITTSQGEFVVGPLTMKKMSRVLKALQPLQHFFKGGWENIDHAMFFDMIAEHCDAAQELLAAGLGKEKSVVEEMTPDEFVELFMALVQENLDFFIRSVIPKLSMAMALISENVKEKIQLPGQTPSNS